MYIRSSDKKSCPNCRGALTTKRDLRNDYIRKKINNKKKIIIKKRLNKR